MNLPQELWGEVSEIPHTSVYIVPVLSVYLVNLIFYYLMDPTKHMAKGTTCPSLLSP